jgi:hypothetical protein
LFRYLGTLLETLPRLSNDIGLHVGDLCQLERRQKNKIVPNGQRIACSPRLSRCCIFPGRLSHLQRCIATGIVVERCSISCCLISVRDNWICHMKRPYKDRNSDGACNRDHADRPFHVSTASPSSQETFTPEPNDVLLGRGRWYASHTGNQRLQVTINAYLDRYRAALTRPEKTEITQEILRCVKTGGTQSGRFLKFDEPLNGWVQVDDEVARLKISQAMRYSIRSFSDGIIKNQSMFDDHKSTSVRILDQSDSSSAKTEAPDSQYANQIPCVSNDLTTMLTNPRPARTNSGSSLQVLEDLELEPDDNEEHILSDEAILSSLGYSIPRKDLRPGAT